MFTKNYSTLWRSSFSLLGLSLAITLTGCSNMPSINAPDTTPIHTPTTNQQTSSDKNFTRCPPYNPEQTMCTAQYDPVCVTVNNGATISYRTAGNACSACGTTSAVGYVKGQCI
ncbi:hypothetical protein ES754_01225 [Psychrobacter frigidicola]|uniref:Kazal-like domain-containing protein n=1 Tax=Psychrobacter frigidicola TaxID=45611 RepID=A0A5C7A4V4_9GAMM|nr:hypothetical protein [Psychrobacter frigidicola]TXD97640.1 hypothetical protein ES754_01225 [Psychrobacter frigidicola]